jgi:predicted O-methyltransferase YrrM
LTAGGSSVPEVQALLRVLAAGRRCAELGTAFGEGAAAMAETAASVVTVERDPERAAIAAGTLSSAPNVELLVGDWQAQLAGRGPFGLVFLDAGLVDGGLGLLTATIDAAVALLEPGGLLVKDDLTPGRPIVGDPVRTALFEHPHLVATELAVSPRMAVVVAARR